MSRSDSERIDDILQAARDVARLVSEGKDAFEADWKNALVAERLLQVIGEAANGLSVATMDRYGQVPWPLIRGLRNRITHEYHRLDSEVIWETLVVSVPELAEGLSDVGTASTDIPQ